MAIHEIAIGIVLDNKRIRVKPIIKDLTAQNMSANSPTKLITILLKPDVTFELAVEIIDLKARVIRLVICMDLSRTDKKALEGRN